MNIIWIQTAFPGDVVLTSAALRLARDEFSGLKQFVVTTTAGREILRGRKDLAGVFALQKKSSALWSEFRRLTRNIAPGLTQNVPTYILQPHLSPRSSLLAMLLARAFRAKRVTFQEAALAFAADMTVPRITVLHEAQRVALLLEPLGVGREKIVAAKPDLGSAPPLDEAFRDAVDGKIIAVAPGSVWGTKRWLPERYAHVIDDLLARHTAARVVLIGSPAEMSIAEAVLAEVKHKSRVISLVGKTSIAQLLGLFPHFDLLLANDSSPIHFASAFGIPTVAIFGATTSALGFGPLAAKSAVIEDVGLACRPCSLHGPQLCPLGHFLCMKNVSSGTVVELANACLASP